MKLPPPEPTQPSKPLEQPLDFVDPTRSNLTADEQEVDDRVVEEYAQSDRQRQLREKIQAQDLPVSRRREEVSATLKHAIQAGNGITLLQGETGSGKSLFSPLIFRKLLRQLGRKHSVVVMQPRRDAASGVARAMAAVADETLGETIGFSTSEMKAVRRNTEIFVVTPGIFLRYLMSGELRSSDVGAIIVDELHEGSIDYHLALGLMRLMQQRGELPPTLLTSATLHKERIQNFFELPEDQYLKVEGRAHPVTKQFAERAHEATKGKYEYIRLAAEEVKQAGQTGRGDILVFMPGAREISDCINQIKAFQLSGVEVLPLHGGLSPKDRDYALSGDKPNGVRRRVIVATNIAETSVTVPGITLVVDSCRERSVRFNPSTGIEELGTSFISKDQAEQRAGRAGRVQPGECIRIVTAEDFEGLAQHPESEIRRSNLAHVILRLKRLGIEPTTFPFIEPPDSTALQGGEKELRALGALDQDSQLTARGRLMGEMPFEPRIARMLLEAKERKCLESTLVLAAFEREGNVLLGPSRKDEENASGYDEKSRRLNARKAVQSIQNRFDRGGSDWLKALNVFAEALDNGVLEAMRRDHSPEGRVAQGKFRKWCDQYYLKAEALTHIAYRLQDYARYAGIQIDFKKLRDQLKSANDVDLGCVIVSSHPDQILYLYDAVGLPGYRKLTDGYAAGEINLSPGSESFDLKPKLCISGQISQGRGSGRKGAEIMRNYAQSVHPVSFEVLRQTLPHLVQERTELPTYDASSDQITARVTFHPKDVSQIELGSENRVIEGQEAVQAFARALAWGQVALPCVEWNNKVLAELDVLYHRSRGQVQKPPDMVAWYTEQLGGAFRKSEAAYINAQLQLRLEEFYPAELQAQVDEVYPEQIQIHGQTYNVQYKFQPAQGHWNAAEKFSALVELDPKNVFEISTEDIPSIGPAAARVVLTLRTKAGWMQVESTHIDELKDKVDEQRIILEWERWREDSDNLQAKPQPITIYPLQPLPQVHELASPIAYTKNWRGDPVFVYPAIMTRQEYSNSTGQYTDTFQLSYFPSEEKAQAEQVTSMQRKQQMDQKEQRRIDREHLLEPVRARLAEIQSLAASLEIDYAQHGLTWQEVRELRNQYLTAQRLLQGSDTDPRQASELLEQIQNTIAQKKDELEKKRTGIEDAQQLRVRLQSLVAEKLLFRPRYYGLDTQAAQGLKEKWDQADKIIRPDYSGSILNTQPSEAIAFMREVEAALAPLQEVNNPLQIEFLEAIEGRNRNRARMIEVRGAQLLNSTNLDGEDSGFSILKEHAHRTDRRRAIYNVGAYRNAFISMNQLTLWSGTMRTAQGHYVLRDGLYVIVDNGAVYSVQKSASGQIEAVARLEPDFSGQLVDPNLRMNDPYESPWVRVGEDQSQHEPAVAMPNVGSGNTPEQPAAPVVPTGPKANTEDLSRLAGAFSVKGLKQPKDMSAPVSEPVVQAAHAPLKVEATAPKETEVMTEQIRQDMHRELEFLRQVIDDLKGLEQKPVVKGRKLTDREEALIYMHEQAVPNLYTQWKVVADEVKAESAIPGTVRGRIANLRNAIESQWKRIGFRVVSGYAKDWIEQMRNYVIQIPAAIDAHADAQEYIQAELITKDDLLHLVRQKALQQGQAWMKGAEVPPVQELITTSL